MQKIVKLVGIAILAVLFIILQIWPLLIVNAVLLVLVLWPTRQQRRSMQKSKQMQAPGPIQQPEPPPHPGRIFGIIGIAGFGFIILAMITVWGNQPAGMTTEGIDSFINQSNQAMQLMMLGTIVIIVCFLAVVATSRQPRKLLEDVQEAQEREAKDRAANAMGLMSKTPNEVGGAGVLGAAIFGTLPWCVSDWLTLPAPELGKHGVAIGSSGSGKTESLLRLAYVAAVVYGYRIFFVDAKGDPGTAARFLAIMRSAGMNSAMFPREPFNGFHGDASAILNRLMSIVDFTEPYYEDMTRDVLTSVCFDRSGPPASSRDLLQRLNMRLAGSPKDRNLEGVVLRYRSFFGVLAGSLDNGFSWESGQAAYILLDGLSLKKQAASLGRYLLEDFTDYAVRRKPAGRDLLIVDEYSAISNGSDAANLIERIRSYNCAVILSSQSYAALGEERDAERILDAANFLLLHRTAAPELLVPRAGSKLEIKKTYQFGGNPQRGLEPGNIQMEEAPAIHPDQVKRLDVGEAIMISAGHYIKARIARTPEPDPALVDKARAWIDQQPSAPASTGQHQAQPSGPQQKLATLIQQPQPSAAPPVQHQTAPMFKLPQRGNTGQHQTTRNTQQPQRPQQPPPEIL